MVHYDLIIIGAGPAGLAAAIAAKQAGLHYKVFEKGALVNSLFHFPSQMVFFTTPDLLEIGGLPFVTPHGKPTRDETLRYYRRVVEAFELDMFSVRTENSAEVREKWSARTVVIATGCYDRPNRLGVPGEDLSHVSHYFTESHGFYGKRVVVVGGKNSAAEAALELYRSGVDVTLVHRGSELGSSIKYWVKPDIENRIKEGSIPARFEANVVEIQQDAVLVKTGELVERLPADGVFLLTGYIADVDFLRSAGINVDSNNVPERDTESFETNVPGLYIAGAVVAGANRGEVFIENGRFHGRVVVDHIVKRLERVSLTIS